MSVVAQPAPLEHVASRVELLDPLADYRITIQADRKVDTCFEQVTQNTD